MVRAPEPLLLLLADGTSGSSYTWGRGQNKTVSVGVSECVYEKEHACQGGIVRRSKVSARSRACV